MRTISFKAPLFLTPATRPQSEKVLRLVLEALTTADEIWLRTHPDTPRLYESGVRYQREPLGTEEWLGIPEILRRGVDDCEGLAAWRAAELRVRDDIRAVPDFTSRMLPGGTRMYHIIVRWPAGQIEDPSRRLGMGATA